MCQNPNSCLSSALEMLLQVWHAGEQICDNSLSLRYLAPVRISSPSHLWEWKRTGATDLETHNFSEQIKAKQPSWSHNNCPIISRKLLLHSHRNLRTLKTTCQSKSDSKKLQTIDWSVFVNISFQLSPLLAALSYYILSISHLQLLNSDCSSNLLYLEIISLLVLASDLIRHTLTCCEGYIVKLWSPLTRLTCGQLSSAPKA